MTEPRIYYKKVRDFAGVFGATFGYIRQNFKPLYGSLLFFAGPLILIATAASTYMMGASLGTNRILRRGIEDSIGDIMLAYITSMLILFIGITVYNVILNRNVIENEKLTGDEPLTIKHSSLGFWGDFFRMLGNTLLLFIVAIIFFVVIALAFGGLFALTGGGDNSAGAVLVALFGVLLLLIFFIILGPILAFVPMAALFVSQRDNISVFPAMGKVFHYMRGHFWSTWVVNMVGLLLYSVMGFIVQVPVFIMQGISSFSKMSLNEQDIEGDNPVSVTLIVVTSICTLLSYGIMVIYHLIAIYQYTNLEEKKEGTSIIDKINQIQ